jgi:hypothetical protein
MSLALRQIRMDDLTEEELMAVKKLFIVSANMYFNKQSQLKTLESAYQKIFGSNFKNDWEDITKVFRGESL